MGTRIDPQSQTRINQQIAQIRKAGESDPSKRNKLVRELAIMAKEAHVPPELVLMCALVESNFRNVNYGDRDSLGMFQQRNAWGSAAERTDPLKSAKLFLYGGHGGQDGAVDYREKYGSQGPGAWGAWVQDVQVSAYPDRYQERIGQAREMLIAAGVDPTPGGEKFATGPSGLTSVGDGGGTTGSVVTEHQDLGSAAGKISGFRRNPWLDTSNPYVTAQQTLTLEDLLMLAAAEGITLAQLIARNPGLLRQLQDTNTVKAGTQIHIPKDNYADGQRENKIREWLQAQHPELPTLEQLVPPGKMALPVTTAKKLGMEAGIVAEK
jgi:hypothetical protein